MRFRIYPKIISNESRNRFMLVFNTNTWKNSTTHCSHLIFEYVYEYRCFTSYEYEADYSLQYIPRNMHTVFALLCFVVVIHWLIFPYPSGLLHWHCGNLTIAPVRAKQPWWIWIDTSCEFIMNDCITTTKQSTTKPCAYFLGYTVIKLKCFNFLTEMLYFHLEYTGCIQLHHLDEGQTWKYCLSSFPPQYKTRIH